MTEMRTKLRKFRYWLKHDLFSLRLVVLVLAIAICLAFSWGAISAMSRNWALAQELINRQHELALLELEVDTLELENEYYLSDEYQELAARKYRNKKLPGETMIYLPANSETAKNKHKTANTNQAEFELENYSNFQQWMQFLFGANR